jgi:tripartite-type tricarboxylate transporter receptor subunit TctC
MLAVASMSVLAALLISGEGHAQPYPNRPVRVIVGFGPGAPDSVARIISPQLAARMGQPFVVENRPAPAGDRRQRGREGVARRPPC